MLNYLGVWEIFDISLMARDFFFFFFLAERIEGKFVEWFL